MTRYVRSSVLDVIRLDYVTTARAKGLGERIVIIKHVVRNALIPVVTLVALQMPAIFGGAIVTEQIFRIPGIGSLLISAILANDTPVIMAVHLRVRLPRRAVQPHRGYSLWMARSPHHASAEFAAAPARPARRYSPWLDAWRRFRRHRLALASASSSALMILAIAVHAVRLCRVPINEIDFTARLKGPSFAHPFGTDDLGQDLLARMLYGGRISLAVGFAAMVVAIVVGTHHRRNRRHVARLGRPGADVADRPVPVASARCRCCCSSSTCSATR